MFQWLKRLFRAPIHGLRCKFCPSPAAGEDAHIWPSLCHECGRRAWERDPAKVAMHEAHNRLWEPRLEAIRLQLVASRGDELRHRRLRAELARLTQQEHQSCPVRDTNYPEQGRARDDPQLAAEFEAWGKRLMKRNGARMTTADLAQHQNEALTDILAMRREVFALVRAGRSAEAAQLNQAIEQRQATIQKGALECDRAIEALNKRGL